MSDKFGIYIIYGDELPNGGVVFLAPIMRSGNLGKVHEAFEVCSIDYPRGGRIGKFKDRWCDGSISKNEKEDWEWFNTSVVWKGHKYLWDTQHKRFIRYEG